MSFKFKKDQLYAVPLGGCGHFGANVMLYGFNDQWIMVDCGMGFADDTLPGIDILLPDLSFAKTLGDKLLGLIVTHGHEDHIGAIEYLWPKIKCPIYGTGFTLGLLREKLMETKFRRDVEMIDCEPGQNLELGPFEVLPIPMAHSIPETVALAITSPAGTFLHTGDWKIDPEPITPFETDAKALQALADQNLLAVIGDSTNAMVPGHSGSEGGLRENFAEIFSEFDKRIVVTCFSSNVARLDSVARAAQKVGRSVALVGRSLWRMTRVAKSRGYLEGIDFLNDKEASKLPREKIVLVCTGSQGEGRAALSRIATGSHPQVRLAADDVVLFSSKAIPGNEKDIFRIKNSLLSAGVHVITDRDAPIHVSGHPYRDELRQLYDWTKPQAVMPVHGEPMQQQRHAGLARECGIDKVTIPNNGDVVCFTPDGPEIAGAVPAGLLALDGDRFVPIDHDSIAARRRLMHSGSVVVTLVCNDAGALLADPQITALGVVDENCEADNSIVAEAGLIVERAVASIPKTKRHDDTAISEIVRVAVRRYFNAQYDKKPQTRVHLVRV